MKSKHLSLSLLSLVLPIGFSFSIISCSKSNDNNLTNSTNNNVLNSEGGNVNNLQVDKYLSIVKCLNLNQSTIISSLTSQSLSKTLQKSNYNYQNLELKILDGSSEKDGKLILNLFGQYNSQNINEIITINNFDHNFSDFEIANIKLNEQQYFDNHQPIVNSNLSITNELSIKEKLIENVDFTFNNLSFDWNQMNKWFQLKDILIETKNNQLFFSFAYLTKFMIFQKGQWIVDSDSNQENLRSKNKLSISMPTLKSLMSFMLDQFKLNESIFVDQFASYYKGLFNMSVNLKADQSQLLDTLEYEDIIQKYEPIYFPNIKIAPQIDINNYDFCKADDFSHTLIFKVNLIDFTNSENDLSISKNFESNGFKDISSFLNTNQNQINNIVLKNNDDSSLGNSIKKNFKNEITNMFNQATKQTISLDPSDSFVSNILDQNWGYIYDFDSQEKNATYLDRINKSYDFSLFNEPIIDFGSLNGKFNSQTSFDIDSGLFQNDHNQIFMISNIHLEFNKNNINMTLSMNDNPNIVSLTFYGNIKMLISEQEFSQLTEFSLTIPKSSWKN